MEKEIVIEKIRQYLIDYYGTAMLNASPAAMMDLIEVENATNELVLKLALDNKLNLDKFTK